MIDAMTRWKSRFMIVLLAALAALSVATLALAIVSGAGFTTFDAAVGGCNDSPNGINCNNYSSKDTVYMSGGPTAAGLSDGNYFFAVLTPGSQNGGFIEGAPGNLSDTTAGGTTGDTGSGDDVSNRTFTVTDHQITSYTGSHAKGTSPNGRFIIGLAPFDDTDNPGGVYILAICQEGATSPSQCKYDAFRIAGGGEQAFAQVSGLKYYDANANGQLDAGEVGIGDWPINFNDSLSGTVVTDSDGKFTLSLVADTYTVTEQVAGLPWFQTGNLVDQTSVAGGATATLTDKSYTISVVDNSTISGLNFGNLCVGAGGGLTLGFWSNKNGAALFGADDLALMVTLNLRNANGTDFNPTSYSQFRTWLLNATATNMAYMLSAQLAAMELNVLNGFANGSSLIYAPGTNSANANGFASVSDIMAEADFELGFHGTAFAGDWWRAYQEALKNALDNANNNRTFVQPTAATCPAPVFP